MPFEEKLMGEKLSDYETYQILQYLINQSRINAGINTDDLMKCSECCENIRDLLYKNENYVFDLDIINTKSLELNITHAFCIVGFNTLKGPRYFVIDPTFEQFNTLEYPLNNGITFDSKNSFSDRNFFDRLINEKYFELTKDNMIKYISGLYNIGENKPNIQTIIQNIESRLKKYNINYSSSKDMLINEENILAESRIRLIEVLKKYKNTLSSTEKVTNKSK